MNRGGGPTRRAVLLGAGSVLAAGCLEVEATPAPTGDDWRTYGRDPGRTRSVPDADVSRDGVDVAWERSVGASGWLPPLVVDETVYCQYANGLFVLDLESGDGTRSDTHGGFGRGGPMALASTSRYDDGVLVAPFGGTIAGYAADPDGWPGTVEGFGERRSRWWTDGETPRSPPRVRRIPQETNRLTAPIALDERLLCLHPEPDGAVSAIDANDGRTEWRFSLGDLEREDEHAAVPIGHVVDEATETVVVSSQVLDRPLLVGVDLADGSLEWVDGPDDDTYHAERRDSLLAADGVVYAVESDAETVLVRELVAETGARGWERTLTRSDHRGLAVDDDAIYHHGLESVDDGPDSIVVTALERADGAVRWERSLEDRAGHFAQPPTVAGDLVLVPTADGLHALDRETGDSLWTFTETAPTSGGSEMNREAETPVVVSGDRIVVGMTIGLYCLE